VKAAHPCKGNEEPREVARVLEVDGGIYPGRLDRVLRQLFFELCDFFVDLGASLLRNSDCCYTRQLVIEIADVELVGSTPSNSESWRPLVEYWRPPVN
jgi:hypothetical protein